MNESSDNDMPRRRFMQMAGVGTTALLGSGGLRGADNKGKGVASQRTPPTFEEWLRVRHQRVHTPESVEAFLQRLPNNQWAKFDEELGYIPSDSIQRDGMDGARSVYRYGEFGERKVIQYADRSCRVNTYGDSFTHGHQVSDGETWQEQLAAHLGEPIRNFGVGGYGVFQAFARLRRMEQTAVKAPYIVFNIFDDDHQRSLMPWRSFQINYHQGLEMVHGTPWTHLHVNLDSGKWEEVPSFCPTPNSLRDLLSFERAAELMAGSESIQLFAMLQGVADVPHQRIRRLADWARVKFDFSSVATRRQSAATLREAVSRSSTLHVLEKLLEFVARDGRRLMVLFSYGNGTVMRACSGEPAKPADVELFQWLKERNVPFVDARAAHLADFAQFRLSSTDYVKRLFNGHYTPRGNQFFAYAIKNAVVEWLDPKPIAYRSGGTIIDFQDGRYLEQLPDVKRTKP